MFTQFKFSADQIAAAVASTIAALEASMPGTEPAAYAAQIVAHRLRVHPQAYVEFGPYWWAVKQALRGLNADFGAADDALVRDAYGAGLEPLGALVAGETFKDFYRRTFLMGAAQFWLDDGGEESYVLFDADMEARRLGPGAVAVGANLNAIPMADEPETEKPPEEPAPAAAP